MPDQGGREAVYQRDIEMVDRADAVVAYFAPDAVMERRHRTRRGSGHGPGPPGVRLRPREPGLVIWVGGHDPPTPSEPRLPL